MNNVMIALQIMWKGMVGIFVAVLVIMLVVWLLSKMDKPSK